ncbi:unnamed protein product [Urochloa humidicola]
MKTTSTSAKGASLRDLQIEPSCYISWEGIELQVAWTILVLANITWSVLDHKSLDFSMICLRTRTILLNDDNCASIS